ncbi:hypothetical protein IU438_09295 [Nocardia cyriacigeorgica]|uniref:hypothetical protein n=1 Tax=Nocardia cyriacigeorgica TaxID=135487 RepID=UPI0018952483|nr:hypothetical protein [Nocardia cyriacigeorgica]MBF6089666.1 hypothetical protein [Nocardia cyriacigeorgica]MBF6094374.1 hypothetical protein [Nocardia cyriacigeorgica]MBF6097147.1 hypothetical protein [Nocardia cyriacigeorgica]MBF6316556.1 hypothetical protein [Nocardia cyriacigeorgica]MBF6395986.1 hypothetical protein [Nocardia cyriacigeorgica]
MSGTGRRYPGDQRPKRLAPGPLGVSSSRSDGHIDTTAVKPFDDAEYCFHIAGRPTRAKIERLHQHWFDNGIPVVIDLAPA